MFRVDFKENQLVIFDPFFKLFAGRTKKIPYEMIERIELPKGEFIFFYMKNGKVIKARDLGVLTFYAEFGEMLKKYKIPYKGFSEGEETVFIETVREKAERTRKLAVEYGNRSLKEKLGPEYELDARVIERVVGTSIVFHLLKNGVVQKETDIYKSIDEEPVVDEMDIAFICEWDPVCEQGQYILVEEAYDEAACEKYIVDVVLDNIYAEVAPGADIG